MKVSKQELFEWYERLQWQKEDMNKKFELAAEQLRMKADYKNSLLDEKLA